MDSISDWDNDMDNNNNDANVDIKHELSNDQIKNEFSMESDHLNKEQPEDTLLNFDSVPQHSENNNDGVTFDSTIAFKVDDMFADNFNDDTFGNFKNDYCESETPETKVNITNQITFNEENLNQTHTNVHEDYAKKEQQNQSKIRKTSFQLKTNNQISSGSNCDVCSKTVYPMEKLTMDSKVYHKSCFRCCVCQKSLTPSFVTKFKNNIFCKPHYIEKFRMRGKYDDIDISNSRPDTTTYNQNYTPMNQPTNYQPYETNKSVENKDKFVKTKDLTSRFEDSSRKSEETFERKDPINIGSQRRVSDAAKAWTENPGGSQILPRGNSNNNNINDLEKSQMSKGSVKDLMKLFQANN